MIGIRSAISIRARGHWPHLEAVYMTAPRSFRRKPKKPLPRGGRPYMTIKVHLPYHRRSVIRRGDVEHAQLHALGALPAIDRERSRDMQRLPEVRHQGGADLLA